MANKTIITRIKNKVDTLAAWNDYNGTLLDGEIAVVRVPTGESYVNPVTNKEEPVVELLMKVGDGSNTFASLPWMSAKASDVYNWAKEADPSTITVKYNKSTSNTADWHSSTLADVLKDLEAAEEAISGLQAGMANVRSLLSIDPTSAGEGVVQGITYDSTAGKFSVSYGLVQTGDIADSAVTTAKIADSNVTTAKIADKNVTDAKIDTVSASKVIVTPKSGDNTATETLVDRLSTISGEMVGIKTAIAGGVHFRGTVSAEPSKDLKVVNGTTIIVGDVVIYDGKEFICTAVAANGETSWEQLGDVTRIGALETKVNNLDYHTNTADQNIVATTHKFVSEVTQTDGKIAVTYAQPEADDVKYGTDSTVEAALDDRYTKGETYTKGEVNAVIAAQVHGNITNDGKLATANAVVVTDENKNIVASTTITTTELGYLDGVTSNIQEQLNGKAASEHGRHVEFAGSGSATTVAHSDHTHDDTYGQAITGIQSNYVRYTQIGTTDKYQMHLGTDDDVIIFDCGGAND
jgi:hypothetical protein